MATIHPLTRTYGPRHLIITQYHAITLECAADEAGEARYRVCGILVDSETYRVAFALLMEWKNSGYELDEAHFWKSLRARKRFGD